MPTYDFRCDDGHTFERTCKMAEEDTEVPCEHEGCTKLARNACTIGGLDHGIGMFRDQAREGRFDENNLSTKYMSSGRGAWRNR